MNVAFPIIKPGFGALAIFTFINSWNEYPLQLVMLTQNESKTIALGIASKLSEMSKMCIRDRAYFTECVKPDYCKCYTEYSHVYPCLLYTSRCV